MIKKLRALISSILGYITGAKRVEHKNEEKVISLISTENAPTNLPQTHHSTNDINDIPAIQKQIIAQTVTPKSPRRGECWQCGRPGIAGDNVCYSCNS